MVKQRNGSFEAVAVDPISSMISVENDELHVFAIEVKGMLQEALNAL